MEKFPAILIVMSRKRLKESLVALNSDNIELNAILVYGSENVGCKFGSEIIPVLPFRSINRLLRSRTSFLWLLSGSAEDASDIAKVKDFLVDEGISEQNIVNCTVFPNLNRNWLANVKRAESTPIDFFATGNAEVELEVARLGNGVNLADSDQDLLQSLRTAQFVFKHQSSIKFALIGLSPHCFRYDNQSDFAMYSKNLQYMLAIQSEAETNHDKFFLYVISERVRQFVEESVEPEPRPHFDASLSELADWKSTLEKLTQNFRADVVEKNLVVLEEYIKLCREHDATPIGLILPVSPILHRHYPQELLFHFRQTLRQLQSAYDFEVIDLFELPLGYDCFSDHTHLNLKGARQVEALIKLLLQSKNILPKTPVEHVSYYQFYQLSKFASKDEFNSILERAFEPSIEKIRSREKIKISFIR